MMQGKKHSYQKNTLTYLKKAVNEAEHIRESANGTPFAAGAACSIAGPQRRKANYAFTSTKPTASSQRREHDAAIQRALKLLDETH